MNNVLLELYYRLAYIIISLFCTIIVSNHFSGYIFCVLTNYYIQIMYQKNIIFMYTNLNELWHISFKISILSTILITTIIIIYHILVFSIDALYKFEFFKLYISTFIYIVINLSILCLYNYNILIPLIIESYSNLELAYLNNLQFKPTLIEFYNIWLYIFNYYVMYIIYIIFLNSYIFFSNISMQKLIQNRWKIHIILFFVLELFNFPNILIQICTIFISWIIYEIAIVHKMIYNKLTNVYF